MSYICIYMHIWMDMQEKQPRRKHAQMTQRSPPGKGLGWRLQGGSSVKGNCTWRWFVLDRDHARMTRVDATASAEEALALTQPRLRGHNYHGRTEEPRKEGVTSVPMSPTFGVWLQGWGSPSGGQVTSGIQEGQRDTTLSARLGHGHGPLLLAEQSVKKTIELHKNPFWKSQRHP